MKGNANQIKNREKKRKKKRAQQSETKKKSKLIHNRKNQIKK